VWCVAGVHAGQVVEAGQQIAVVEAMKMQVRFIDRVECGSKVSSVCRVLCCVLCGL
jgi:acetyl/propionyl-CoA carboxylase alpha subunit